MWHRFVLAWKCFFLVLFARRLPPDAIELLPPPDLAPRPALPPPHDGVGAAPERVEQTQEVFVKPAEPVAREPAVDGKALERGALVLLGVLQREGRLVDFLEEDIDSYADAQVGAAVRDIHRGCRKALADHVKVEPV